MGRANLTATRRLEANTTAKFRSPILQTKGRMSVPLILINGSRASAKQPGHFRHLVKLAATFSANTVLFAYLNSHSTSFKYLTTEGRQPAYRMKKNEKSHLTAIILGQKTPKPERTASQILAFVKVPPTRVPTSTRKSSVQWHHIETRCQNFAAGFRRLE